jgi:ABC-type glycerol-3-phosphate transport system substrate-binding protein
MASVACSECSGKVVTPRTNPFFSSAPEAQAELSHLRSRLTIQGAGDDLSWAPPPGFTPDERETVYGFQLTINRFSKQKEAAWQFVKFMTTPAAQAIAAQGGEVVARASAYNDPYCAIRLPFTQQTLA